MGSAIDRPNVVRKPENVIAVGIDAPLQRDFNLDIVFFRINENNFFMQVLFFTVHVGDVFLNSTFIEIFFNAEFAVFCRTRSFIREDNPNTRVQVGQFFQPPRQCAVIKLHGLCKDCIVRHEMDLGSSLAACPIFRRQIAHG